MREYAIVLCVAAVVTFFATPAVRWVSIKMKAMTPVRDRDVHSIPIPRLGGRSSWTNPTPLSRPRSLPPFLGFLHPPKRLMHRKPMTCGLWLRSTRLRSPWLASLLDRPMCLL